MINVLMYTPAASGGIVRYSRDLVHELAFAIDRPNLKILCPPGVAFPNEPNVEVIPAVPRIRHRDDYSSTLSWAAARVLFYARRETSLLREARRVADLDVVHLQELARPLGPLVLAVLHLSGFKTCITVHDVFPHKIGAGLRRKGYQRLNRLTWRGADCIFVHSHEAELLVNSTLGERCRRRPKVVRVSHPLHRPVAGTAAVAPRAPRNTVRVLSLGYVRPIKNLEALVEAMAKLPPTAELLIAGSPSDSAYALRLQRLTSALGLEKRVRLDLRFVAEAEVDQLMADADIVALPYLRRFTSQSGVFMSALALGKPIITTGAGAVGDIVEKYGCAALVDEDALSISNGIRALLDPIARETLSRRSAYAFRELERMSAGAVTGRAYNDIMFP